MKETTEYICLFLVLIFPVAGLSVMPRIGTDGHWLRTLITVILSIVSIVGLFIL